MTLLVDKLADILDCEPEHDTVLAEIRRYATVRDGLAETFGCDPDPTTLLETVRRYAATAADVDRVVFEQHFAEAVGAGIDPQHRGVYEAHWDRNADLQGTPKGRAQILDTGLALARRYWGRTGRQSAEHPRLHARGRPRARRRTRPESTEEAYVALQDLASPVGAFIRDRCELGHGEVAVDELWAAWRSWAEENGHRVGTKQRLGRDLRAAHAPIRIWRPGHAGAEGRFYRGITLRPVGGIVSYGHIARYRVTTRHRPTVSHGDAQPRVVDLTRGATGPAEVVPASAGRRLGR